METNLKPNDLDHLVNDLGVNVMKELMILNHTAYGNMLDVIKLTRWINLERIKRFSMPHAPAQH
ncbi:MAG: hypothetical protein R2809_07480 [Flavobacteriales bacterium]